MTRIFGTLAVALCSLPWIPLDLKAEPLQTWPVDSTSILQLAYSPDGQYVATSSVEGKIKVLSRESGGVMTTFDLNRGKGFGLAWSPDSLLIAVGGTDSDPPRQNGVRLKLLGKIRVWNVSTKDTLFSRDLPDGAIFDVDISGSGNTVAAAGYHPKANPKGWVDMWKIANGRQFNARYGRPSDPIFKIQFAPDGKSFFVATADKIYKYSFETPKPVIIEPNVRYIQDIDITADGRYLAIASGDSRSYGATQIWDIQSQRELVKVNLPPAFKAILSVAFSEQGDRIVMGSGESRAQVLIANTTDGELQAAFAGHPKSVSSVAFSPDGKEVAAGDEAGNVRIWKAEPGTTAFWFSKSAEWDGRQLRTRRDFQNKLHLSDTLWSEGEAKVLSDLTDLREVKITLSRVRPEQLRHLSQLTGLEELALDTSGLTDPQLDFLVQLPHLQALEIHGLDTQGNGLRQIAQLANLKTLAILDKTLQNDDLTILSRSESLMKLTLHSPLLTAAGVEQLEGLETLKELNLTATTVGQTDELHLAKESNLRSLRLGTINEQTLTALSNLKKLQQLEFDASELTAEQMIHFVDFELWPRATIRNSPISHDALKLFAVKNPMSRQERLKYHRDMIDSVKKKLASVDFNAIKSNWESLGGIDKFRWEQIELRINFLRQERLRYIDDGGGFGLAAQARQSGNFAVQFKIDQEISQLVSEMEEISNRARQAKYLKMVGLTRNEFNFAKAFNLIP